jgi:uncharacterized protein (UPF0332 family)
MIIANDYLLLAQQLVAGTTEAEWRSAISRAYYAAFHAARDLFRELGFATPRAESAHQYLWLRLLNCSNLPVQSAGSDLNSLRGERNLADYDLQRTVTQNAAIMRVQIAVNIFQLLDTARQQPVRTQITDAMKQYEQSVLKVSTWHP